MRLLSTISAVPSPFFETLLKGGARRNIEDPLTDQISASHRYPSRTNLPTLSSLWHSKLHGSAAQGFGLEAHNAG
jgi:hypothetical protein